MFPYIISKPNIQLYIRDNILKKCSDLFSDINVINSTADIFDRSVISSNGWFLYKKIRLHINLLIFYFFPLNFFHRFLNNLNNQDLN